MANKFRGGLVEQKAAERRQISGIKLGSPHVSLVFQVDVCFVIYSKTG